MLQPPLQRVAAILDEYGTPWALIGGLAVSTRAEPRFTQDADFAVAAASDAEAEAIVQRFLAAGASLGATIEHEATSRFAAVRLALPGLPEDAGLVDLMFAHSGIESEIVAAAERLEVVPEFVAPVASLPHLLALKVLSAGDDRPNDLADIRALLVVASAAHIDEARGALDLIAERGYARGRDLRTLLDQHIARYR